MSSCPSSTSRGAAITSSWLGGALLMGGGSSLLVNHSSSSGTSISFTHKQLSVGVAAGISGGGGISDGSFFTNYWFVRFLQGVNV